MAAVADPGTVRALYLELAPVLRRRFDLRPEEAEDLVQETFLRLLSRPPAETINLRGWLVRVFGNLAHDHFRGAGRWVSLGVDCPDTEDRDAVTETEQIVATWLERFVRRLPPKYGEAVRRADFEEQSMREIAEALSLSLSGAKSRVQRGRLRLLRLLVDCCHFESDAGGRLTEYRCRDTTRLGHCAPNRA